jgi:signal transduction histidine kinase
LLISRIENNQFQADETIALQELLEELLLELEDRIRDRNITVINTMSTSYSFQGNKTLIHILLFNILVNAIKYNKEGGKIILSDAFESGIYRFSVSIPAAELIRNRFQSFLTFCPDEFKSGRTRTWAGYCAYDSAFHHIEIAVTSEPDSGSTFSLLFHLPAKS